MRKWWSDSTPSFPQLHSSDFPWTFSFKVTSNLKKSGHTLTSLSCLDLQELSKKVMSVIILWKEYARKRVCKCGDRWTEGLGNSYMIVHLFPTIRGIRIAIFLKSVFFSCASHDASISGIFQRVGPRCLPRIPLPGRCKGTNTSPAPNNCVLEPPRYLLVPVF